MNQTQLKYIRECLSKRKRALLSAFSKAQQKPHEVKCAEVTIDEWRKKSGVAYYEYEQQVEAKIQDLEERAILGGEFNDIRLALKELEAWQP